MYLYLGWRCSWNHSRCRDFSLDTLKTRLQSKEGWLATGGIRRLYSGLTATLFVPRPQVNTLYIYHLVFMSLFTIFSCAVLLSYECLKRAIGPDHQNPLSLSISLFPFRNCRLYRQSPRRSHQTKDASRHIQGHEFIFSFFLKILRTEGGFGLYRDSRRPFKEKFLLLQFSFQFTRGLKKKLAGEDRTKMALCGSAAGGLNSISDNSVRRAEN